MIEDHHFRLHPVPRVPEAGDPTPPMAGYPKSDPPATSLLAFNVRSLVRGTGGQREVRFTEISLL
jgi:hypothetical protein